ncbi:MAG: RND family efflux transporter MFP subunit [Sphingobacteriales bacterium]|jgi:RND family efflux transporter MFP subunit
MKSTNYEIKMLLGVIILSTFFGCSSSESSPTGDLKGQLDSLRAEKTKIESQILKLEGELPAGLNKKIPLVAVKEISIGDFSHFIKLQGKVESDYNVLISARSAGVVSEVLVEPGTRVNKNQVLAKLENDVLQKGIEEVKTSLEFATTVFQKQEKLWEQNIGSEMQFLSAKNNKNTLERKLSTLYEQLDLNNVKSPIYGKVDEVMLKPGELTTPGMPAFRVVDDKELKVTADVSESYISKINIGNKVVVSFPDIETEITGKIDTKAGVIDPISRTFKVEISVPKGNSAIRPNMVAILNINDYLSRESIAIPQNILQKSEGKDFVFIADGDSSAKAKKVFLELGKSYNGQVEILKGLKKGDKIITKGYLNVNQGDHIEISTQN